MGILDQAVREANAAEDSAERLVSLRHIEAPGWVEPLDLFARSEAPSFPADALPPALESFAATMSDAIGSDAGAVAVATLPVLSGLIPDGIRLRLRRNQSWSESARLWLAVVGSVSAKKTPIINAVLSPIRKLDYERRRKFEADLTMTEPVEEIPVPVQHIVGDATTEAVQEILARQSKVIVVADELAGFLARFDRYATKETGARQFWLECWNGQPAVVNRIKRGTFHITQSACLIGGIQTTKFAQIAKDLGVDGLLQRMFVVNLGRARVGSDADTRHAEAHYRQLVETLSRMPTTDLTLTFTDEATAAFRDFESESLGLSEAFEPTLPHLAGSVGKAVAQVARLSLLLHILERVCVHCDQYPGSPREFVLQDEPVTRETLDRAVAIWEFLFGHAYQFFYEFCAGDAEQVEAIARLILARRWERFTPSSVTHHYKPARRWARQDVAKAVEPLILAGWVAAEGEPGQAPRAWLVNPRVHEMFQEVGEQERERRERVHQTLKKLGRGIQK